MKIMKNYFCCFRRPAVRFCPGAGQYETCVPSCGSQTSREGGRQERLHSRPDSIRTCAPFPANPGPCWQFWKVIRWELPAITPSV